MRGKVITLLGLVLVLLIMSPPAALALDEYSYSGTVTSVLVNKTGGLTVSGRLNCTDAVTQIYAGAVPDDTTVVVNVNWDAYQAVGRTKVVRATYESGIGSICYTNDPAVQAQVQGSPEDGWVWRTLYAYPMGTVQWVYADNGRFAAGSVHIELKSTGEFEGAWLFHQSGWDLRAAKVR